jgi:hypothetical protein
MKYGRMKMRRLYALLTVLIVAALILSAAGQARD